MKTRHTAETILGWDAAWTPNGSGAWCVIRHEAKGWRLLNLEPTPSGSGKIERLREMLREFRPDLLAVDLPVSRSAVTGYRESDRATTRAFSRFGCPVHSPTPERPGAWGKEIMKVLKSHGYQVSTGAESWTRSVLEVYPHTVALYMLRSAYRVPYKIQRAGGYYPDASPAERRRRVAETLDRILDAVRERIHGVPDRLDGIQPLPLRHWKEREDQVDALLCALAGVFALEGHFQPYGDSRSAIWNPKVKELDLSRNHGLG